MQPDPAVHPSKEQLSAFAVGKLSLEEVEKTEKHLSECFSCLQTLQQIQDDTFVGLVQKARTPQHRPPEKQQTPDVADAETQAMPHALQVGPGKTPVAGRLPSLVEFIDSGLRDHPRYRVHKLVGSGGMGAVYRAEHLMMRRTVALKVINPQLVANSDAVERFHLEVQAAARLHHPNIVTAYDAEQLGDVHFLVMEYVQGTDLAQVLTERGPLPVDEACDFAQQVAVGLQHAMENGMVHRDIKPHNLMLTPDGQIKILDFGLAALTTETIASNEQTEPQTDEGLGTLTQAGSIMGTPAYMAPEQARDAHSADIRADIYSLGCTLYSLLTGKPPFPGDSIDDILRAHAKGEAQPLSDARPDAPKELQTVLDRMMATDVNTRYQSPADVATALSEFIGTESKPAEQQVRHKSPLNRFLRVMIAAIAVLIFAGILFIFTDNGQLVIDSKVDDVEVVVRKDGREVQVLDLQTKSTVTRLPSGAYQIALKGNRNDVKLSRKQVTITRWGKEIVTIEEKPLPKKLEPPKSDSGVREKFQQMVKALRGQMTSHERKKFIRERPRFLSRLKQSHPNKIIRLFCSVSEDAHGRLLQNRYLKWKATWLSDPLKDVVHWQIQQEIDRIQKLKKAVPKALDTTAVKDAVVGFALIEDSERKSKILCWYALLPDYPDPLWISLVNLSNKKQAIPTAHQVLEQIRALRDKEYSDLALLGNNSKHKTMPKQLTLLIKAVRGEAAAPKGSELAQEMANPDSRKLLELYANLPDKCHTLFLKQGYLKWSLAQLDRNRQAYFEHAVRLNQDQCNKRGMKSPFTLDQLKDTDVGFAAIEVAEGTALALSLYALFPDNSLTWMSLPIIPGTVPSSSKKALDRLRTVPYSPLPKTLMPSDNGLDRLALLIEMGRGERLQVADRDLNWRMASADTRKIVELFAKLPDESHSAFRKHGYLKWSFAKLDKQRQACFEHFVKQEQKQAQKIGKQSPLTIDLLQKTNVGFANESGMFCLFILFPDDSLIRSVVPIAKSIPSVEKHLVPLRTKPDSSLPPPIDPRDHFPLVHTFKGHTWFVCSVAISGDGKQLVSGSADGTVRVWDVTARRELHAFKGHKAERPTYAAISPDGKQVVTGDWDGKLRFWTLPAAKLIATVDAHKESIYSVSFSTDGSKVLSTSCDKTAKIWDAGTGKPIATLEGHNAFVNDGVFLTDGHHVVTSAYDGTVRLWDVDRAKVVAKFFAQTSNPRCVALSPDNTKVAVGCVDGTIRVFNKSTGIELLRLTKHRDRVMDVAFLSDGRHLLSGSFDRTLRIWDIETGRVIKQTREDGHMFNTLAVTPDGRKIFSAGGIWRVPIHDPKNFGNELDLDIRLRQLPESLWPKVK
ncbi:MAG: WD40 repeat domain-containing serine/threonine protein kinase [Gemmataceae bacterium]